MKDIRSAQNQVKRDADRSVEAVDKMLEGIEAVNFFSFRWGGGSRDSAVSGLCHSALDLRHPRQP